MFFGEIESFVSLIARLKKWVKYRGGAAEADSIVDRFLCVFEEHGVHRNQVPRFFDHGLTVTDMQSDQTIIKKLTEEVLSDVCDLFAVRREWMDGADSQIHPTHDFYKCPKDFEAFIDDIELNNSDANLSGMILAPQDIKAENSALLILKETIGHVGENEVFRYHLCDNWNYRYWKSRVYLTACVALAWNRKCYIRGLYVKQKIISEMQEGGVLLGWKGESYWALGHTGWQPEDMVHDPELFLNNVDPELNSYGLIAGLCYWLELAEAGLMNSYIPPSVEKFRNKLDDLNKN